MTGAIATPPDSLLESLSRRLDAESARRIVEFHVDPEVRAVSICFRESNRRVVERMERSQYEEAISVAGFVALLRSA